jgi:hypothetical protein
MGIIRTINYAPTPGEIRRGCEETQLNWSPAIRRRRESFPRRVPFTLPLLILDERMALLLSSDFGEGSGCNDDGPAYAESE